MNPLKLIQFHEKDYTKSEKIISSYIKNNPDMIVKYSIVEISKLAGVSKSAFLRFCQKLGYTGYSEFKYDLSRYLLSGSNISADYKVSNKEIIALYTKAIAKIPDFFSQKQILKLCELISKANKIRIYGVHETGLSAAYFSYRLSALNIDSEAITRNIDISKKASLSNQDDLNIFLSLSSTTKDIVLGLNNSLEMNAKTALITQNAKSKFLKKSDCFINIPTLDVDKSRLFLDSQSIMMIAINIFINSLAIHLDK